MRALGLGAVFWAALLLPAVSASYDDLNAGIEAYNQAKWDDVILYLDRALAAKDLVPSLQYVAHMDRGIARVVKHGEDGAIADFSAALELRPGDAAAQSSRLILYMGQGKLDAAEQDVAALIAADPDNSEHYVTRGEIEELRGDAEKELADFQTALAKNPGDEYLYFLVGIADFQLGHDATADFTRALQEKRDPVTRVLATGVNPAIGWLWQKMAMIQQSKSGDPDLSFQVYRARWPYPVIAFFQGEATEDAVIAAAGQGDSDVRRPQLCQAEFYLGAWHALYHDDAGARPHFQKAAAECATGNVEWLAAKAELKHVP